MDHRKLKILPLFLCLILIASACGNSSQTQSDVATAVALTVQAQNSLTEVSALPTLTPVPVIELSPTPEAQPATPAPVSNPGCTLSAILIGETPPDNAVFQPGQEFWKTWTIQNTGTCTWDRSYNLVFWSGDLMSGLTSYPLPDIFAPNEIKEISIYLKTPATEGTTTGYWRIQAPWGADFGVGPESSSFYVQIKAAGTPVYGITSVTYNLVREPETGCPTNVRYIVYATITTNGPYEFAFYWNQSDENESGTKTITFTEAGSKTFKREWMIGKGDSPNPRWMQVIVTSPKRQEFDKVTILNNCP